MAIRCHTSVSVCNDVPVFPVTPRGVTPTRPRLVRLLLLSERLALSEHHTRKTKDSSLSTSPTRHRWWFWRAGNACTVAWFALGASAPAFGQDHPASAPSERDRRTSFGVELGFRSGHADRGFVINDRPVLQPVAWVSGSVVEFSVWGSLPLAETTDNARPQIVELELTREHEWGNLTIAPAVRMFFYHDPISPYSTRSLEGWVYLSYDAGPFSLFSNHSLDILTYRWAYFGEAGIESERFVSERVELGGSVAVGWASATFNDAYAGVAQAALDRISAEGWLTVYVNPDCYIGPHVEFSTIVNRDVRAELVRPTFLLLGVATGVEF